MNSKNKTVKFLNILINNLSLLKDEEFDKLLRGEGKLIFKEKEEQIKSKIIQCNISNKTVQSIPDLLIESTSKEDALKIFDMYSPKKNELIEIANILSVHINKSDNKQRLIQKIIEAVVGSKLRIDYINKVEL
ncbi:MAG: hypothetical protein RR620_04690 [Clostridium sp.]